MKFSHGALSRTRSRFSAALKSRGLDLSLSAEQNVWANIIAGKNFPSAKPQAKKDGGIDAIPITPERIQALLRARNREVSSDIAVELFSDAIVEDLVSISNSLFELVRYCKHTGSFIMNAGDDFTKLGVMDAKYAGYIQAGNLPFMKARQQETDWIAASTTMVVAVTNRLIGFDTTDIFAANVRLVQKKENHVFEQYMAPRIEWYGQVVAEKVISAFEPQFPDWDAVDFDRVRDLLYDTMASDIHREKNTWLKADCDLAEAVMDHVAARIRDGLKWLAIEAENDGNLENPVGTIASTVRLSMGKIMNLNLR